MGDQVDLPFDQHEEMQQSRLHEGSQPVDQLEEMIEEIRRLILISLQEFVNKERLNRGNQPTLSFFP
jgi:hypothetical protein